MRRLIVVLASTAFVIAASLAFITHVDAQGPPRGPGGPPPGGPRVDLFTPAAQESIAATRDSMTKVVMQHIAGRESTAAESVFKNIKMFKGVHAERVLRVMNGWSRALGVGCNFCHVPGHWADEDKNNKQVARDMAVMNAAINDTLLPRVFNPDHDRRFVNCTTCHRGRPNPNFDPNRMRPPGTPPPGSPGGNR